jgi:hypothetical protein
MAGGPSYALPEQDRQDLDGRRKGLSRRPVGREDALNVYRGEAGGNCPAGTGAVEQTDKQQVG